MRILVTGAAGGVGRAVIHELREANHHVILTDRQQPTSGRIRGLITADLTDLAEVYDVFGQAKPDGVIHLAANPAPAGHARHRQFMDNLGMVHATMQAAGDMGVRHFVWASSEQASGYTAARVSPQCIPLREGDVIPSINDYAMGKRLGEVMADGMAARYPEMGVVSLRINYVLTDHGRLNRMTHEFYEGHNYQSSNHWAYVDDRDAAVAFRLAVESRKKGHRIFNVAADDTSSVKPTRELFALHFGEGFEFAEEFPEFGSAVDSSAIREDLGWAPKFRIREMVAELERNGSLA